MTRNCHVRFWSRAGGGDPFGLGSRLGVKFPGSTHLVVLHRDLQVVEQLKQKISDWLADMD